MSISFQVLGKPSRDNALLVQIDSGQKIEKLLFDCGEACLSKVSDGDIQKIDHLFFSHLHMDHIGGFDNFFRSNFNRNSKRNRIWGPPQTAQILQHRFQGYMWNLHQSMSASWLVTDIYPFEHISFRFELQEAFSVMHHVSNCPYQKTLFENENFEIKVLTLNHLTPSLAYLVREKPKLNINLEKLISLGLSPGPWLRQLKELKDGQEVSQSSGICYTYRQLRELLLFETPGESIAYLTDFLADEQTIICLSDFLRGCQTMVCEAHYRSSDIDLARRNYHSTTALSASVARLANVDKLILIHLSDRYNPGQYREILDETREIFAETAFPVEWNLYRR